MASPGAPSSGASGLGTNDRWLLTVCAVTGSQTPQGQVHLCRAASVLTDLSQTAAPFPGQ